MNNKKILILFLILAFTLSNCNENLSISILIHKINQNFNQNNRFKAVLLIPEAGCPGCITEAEDFVRKNIMRDNILFIFTRIISQKELKAKLEIEALIPSNIYFDQKNEYAISSDYSEADYPCVIYFDKSNSYNLESASPGKDHFYDKLLMYSSE